MNVPTNQIPEKRIYQKLSKLLEDNELDVVEKIKAEEMLSESKKRLEYYEWLHKLIEFFDNDEEFKHVQKP
jgi:DNA-binding transcriptional regulator GbsR (MarR family)